MSQCWRFLFVCCGCRFSQEISQFHHVFLPLTMPSSSSSSQVARGGRDRKQTNSRVAHKRGVGRREPERQLKNRSKLTMNRLRTTIFFTFPHSLVPCASFFCAVFFPSSAPEQIFLFRAHFHFVFGCYLFTQQRALEGVQNWIWKNMSEEKSAEVINERATNPETFFPIVFRRRRCSLSPTIFVAHKFAFISPVPSAAVSHSAKIACSCSPFSRI